MLPDVMRQKQRSEKQAITRNQNGVPEVLVLYNLATTNRHPLAVAIP